MEKYKLCVEGTESFFVETYNREADAIFRFCLLRTSDREMALVFTQDTFLFTIARNIIIDWYRRKKPYSLEALMDNAGESRPSLVLVAVENTEIEVEAEFLIRKIGELTEPYSNAVYLRCVEELKPREIAQVLGESANVISVRISRGLEQLRRLLHIETNAKTT